MSSKTALISRMMFRIGMASAVMMGMPCFAGGLGAPDAGCDPTITIPAAGGCVWYNFVASAADGSIHAGTSSFNYYVAASEPAWTITTTVPEVFRIVDGGHPGDTFAVYDNGVLLGTTSATPVNPGYTCAGDTSGPGTNPTACWNDPLMSRASFPIAPGNHSFTVVWEQRVTPGDSTLQWFEIGPANPPITYTFAGSMPHFAAQENWSTTFTLVNKSSLASSDFVTFMYGDDGLPLLVPMIVPPSTTAVYQPTLTRTLAPNASLAVQSSGPSFFQVIVGAAQLFSIGPMDGYAIFHRNSDSQEAVVPLETRKAGSYVLPFDNTGGIVLGVALENTSFQPGTVQVVLRNDSGAQIGTGALSLAASAHSAFVLSSQFPATASIRGTAEFVTPAGGQISVLGIRFTPPNALTTIPVLANVGTTGGSIAHLASGNGWTTTFVLVNAGNTTANAHLKFLGDSGNPLSLPISFPQIGPALSSATTVDRSMAAGSSLLIRSTGVVTDPLLIGSAQLTTDGNVSGFVIFRYEPNGQEAVVPLETRQAGGYILAYDNTAGTGTGIALNNTSSQAVNVPITFRNSAGNQIFASTVFLAANGHSAFVLQDVYTFTANAQGTIEFDAPLGAQIGVLGIRTPVAHTFTTLPALAK